MSAPRSLLPFSVTVHLVAWTLTRPRVQGMGEVFGSPPFLMEGRG